MLGHSLAVYLGDAAEDHHGTCQRWPMVLVGDLDGLWKTASRFLQFTGYNKPGHRKTPNFFLSQRPAIRDKNEKFGEADRALADIDTAKPPADFWRNAT